MLLTFAGVARADDGMPALLQFAEKYQQGHTPPAAEKPADGTEKKNRPAVAARKKPDAPPRPLLQRDGGSFSLRRDLQAREQQLAQLQAELNALHQEVTRLRAEKKVAPVTSAPALAEPTLLRQWAADLGRAWRATPDEARTAFLLKTMKKDLAGAKQDAELARRQSAAFRQQAEAAQQTLETQRQADQKAQDSLREIISDKEQKLAGQKKLLTRQEQQPWAVTAEQLKQDAQLRLSYAAGSALGGDILALLDERTSQGVPVEKNALFAGVFDSVSGHLLLPPAQLDQLKAEADNAAGAARTEQLRVQQLEGKDYLAKFSKQKGVKKSDMGFWYRVDYAGKGALTADTVVDVVVKEQLTNGTVIQDMGLSGKVLSQPLSAFPPLFREAMGHLQDHGSMTMVVPPELAYGDTGYPPKVPPGATMVYQLRIDNSQSP
ncbi:FKBP-type peptidyl-prolyl cis-trans isomerase N-terminal domain-containing protein [Serratia ficaria]|uniref:FKBP-type peptidyl-prolyl cis-trans isomerase N-terminal domain-containing protein n=1 Tax=Serratia ficaria TaxID=61651 RepID=UPI00217930D4|nr:FKBP-type peptidyl-prolyl cis-trans isomerase N-terminal domain-containing protein [Serratia ficaria]CAI1508516.1 FKBP-type peptidyl-prolyl cis-trans isomerase fkpA precursor [Serratia ficaria]